MSTTAPTQQLILHRYTEDAYLDYAISVVKERALAKVQDGNKPVHDRILFVMNEMGLAHDAKPVKAARIVGEVMGKYHPHGDSSVYDALVRQAQPFSLRYPLIDGQGNFGSQDGDRAAAMRYTEARLTPIAQLLLSELKTRPVDFRPNYDGSLDEPTQLPARLPFLLLNGSIGIAVGMASSIPSHNLREVAKAAVATIKNPAITTEEILRHMPGPDFPGGAQLITSPGDVMAAYETGRGSFRLRSRWAREDLARGQWQIVVTELPYQTSIRAIMEELDKLTNPVPPTGKKHLTQQQLNLKQRALEFLDYVRDESGRADSLRFVLIPKNSKVDEGAMMAFLLANTSLEDTFSVNLTMLGYNGLPKTKSLAEIFQEWAEYRIATVLRRSQLELARISERMHVLEGRLLAFQNVDKIIEIIRTSEVPRDVLKSQFGMSDIQAEDILELRLRQLGRLEGEKLNAELNPLRVEAHRLTTLIASDALLRAEIIKEVEHDSAKYGDDRRTLLKPDARAQSTSEAARNVSDDALTIYLSKNLWVKGRTGPEQGAAAQTYKAGDGEFLVIRSRTVWPIVFLDNTGRAYSLPASEVPTGRGDGVPLTTLIDLQPGARIVQAFSGPLEQPIIFAASNGYGFTAPVKSCIARNKAGKAFVKLEDGDELLRPRPIDRTVPSTLVLGTTDGRMLGFSCADVQDRPSGGTGLKLIDLPEGVRLSAMRIHFDGPFTAEVLLKGTLLTVPVPDAEFLKYLQPRGRRGLVAPKGGILQDQSEV